MSRPESPRRLIVEADGGSRGNPGTAGYGALVRDPDRPGRAGLLAERAAPVGIASNNVAEYSGLIAGLEAVLELDLADADVLVRMDSKLVVEQMSGRWKIKHEDMRRLALQARDLQRQIEWAGGQVRYEWIPRESNTAADKLSNQGMDGTVVHRNAVDRDAPSDPGSPEQQSQEPQSHEPERHVQNASEPGHGDSTVATNRDAWQPTFGEMRAPDPDGQFAQELSEVLSAESTPRLDGAVRIVLVRHGVTDFTMRRALDGRGGSNPPLNELGQTQARAAAGAVAELLAVSDPGPVHVVTSSLQRAKQTGAAVATELGVDYEIDADWDELGFGDWDGRSVLDLLEEQPDELRRLRRDADYARPGGERRTEVDARVRQALARAVARGGIVIVATHRIVIMSVLAAVLGIDHDRAWLIATGPASLTALEVWPDGSVQVAFVNRTHHLHGLEN